MKIFVTGATGFVGRHLVQRLLRDHEVYGLCRSKEKFQKVNLPFKPIFGDLSSSEWKNQLPKDLDAVIHVAGLVHAHRNIDFEFVNHQGTLHLFEAFKNIDIHFILISSLAALGPGLESEDDLPAPVSAYGRSKRAQEIFVESHFKPCSIIRPPIVIGPYDEGFLEVIKPVAKGIKLSFHSSKVYSIVSVFDLVETIRLVLEKKKYGVFHSSFEKNYSYDEILNLIEDKLGKKAFRLKLPHWVLWILSIMAKVLFLVFGTNLRLTRDKYNEIKQSRWTCSGKKSEIELGQVYKDSLDRILETTIEHYKDQSKI